MNTFKIKYLGNLRTSAIHIDSGSKISTDAPKDNHGLGETFSPTDMVCTALASCILTIMAIAVEKNDIDIKNTQAIVKKTMGNNPRKIAKIEISSNQWEKIGIVQNDSLLTSTFQNLCTSGFGVEVINTDEF